MRPKRVTISLAAADDNGVCQSQTPAAGGSQTLTINGALATGGVATMDVARHVSITSAGNDSGRTFTVTGTDRYGNSISESITGPNTTTVNGSKNFLTVTQVAVDDDTAAAITVGSADEADTPWIPMCRWVKPFNVNIGCVLSSTANLAFEMEHTFSDVQAEGFEEEDAVAIGSGIYTRTSTGAVDSTVVEYDQPVVAVRGAITSYAAGSVTFNINQAG